MNILSGKIQKTVEAHGCTPKEVIETIIVRNWQSIEPHWMNKTNHTKGGNGRDKDTEYRRETAKDLLREKFEEAGYAFPSDEGRQGMGHPVPSEKN
jgi:hypothetical protein